MGCHWFHGRVTTNRMSLFYTPGWKRQSEVKFPCLTKRHDSRDWTQTSRSENRGDNRLAATPPQHESDPSRSAHVERIKFHQWFHCQVQFFRKCKTWILNCFFSTFKFKWFFLNIIYINLGKNFFVVSSQNLRLNPNSFGWLLSRPVIYIYTYRCNFKFYSYYLFEYIIHIWSFFFWFLFVLVSP